MSWEIPIYPGTNPYILGHTGISYDKRVCPVKYGYIMSYTGISRDSNSDFRWTDFECVGSLFGIIAGLREGHEDTAGQAIWTDIKRKGASQLCRKIV
jgi:hypothetical protein